MKETIFERHPLAADPVMTSAGPQPTPYHVYDGRALLIGGSADLAAVTRLLEPEEVQPLRTVSGRALMAIWLTEHDEASHGAHRELQISLYVSHRAAPPLPDGAFALLRALLQVPEARQLCHGLWNDSEQVIAYNREILGLAPRLADIDLRREGGRVRFDVREPASDEAILQGDVSDTTRPSMAAAMALLRSFGLGGAIRAARTPVIEMRVVNPVTDRLPRNVDARTLSRSDKIAARLFDPGSDRLEILAEPYRRLGFQADFVEEMRGFQLVYLEPEREAAEERGIDEGRSSRP